jgi:hypothetical protein
MAQRYIFFSRWTPIAIKRHSVHKWKHDLHSVRSGNHSQLLEAKLPFVHVSKYKAHKVPP